MTGFVFVDKPQGLSSFDVVRKIRREYDTRQCGHTGTLDPLATGVLVVAVGAATRYIPFINNHDKKYEVTFDLGYCTNTYDSEGEVSNKSDIKPKREEVEAALELFSGEIEQIPPMFSAIKQNGKKLYELARKGQEVQRQSRKVTIYSSKLLAYDESSRSGKAEVFCSNGTYIRSLVFDLGNHLGCFATMTGLRRTQANGVEIEKCFDLEQIDGSADFIKPVFSLLNYPKITIDQKQAEKFSHGQALKIQNTDSDGLKLVFDENSRFCGLAEMDLGSGMLKARRVFCS